MSTDGLRTKVRGCDEWRTANCRVEREERKEKEGVKPAVK